MEQQELKQYQDIEMEYLIEYAHSQLENIKTSCENFVDELIKRAWDFANTEPSPVKNKENYLNLCSKAGIEKINKYYSRESWPKLKPYQYQYLSKTDAYIKYSEIFKFKIETYHALYSQKLIDKFSEYASKSN